MPHDGRTADLARAGRWVAFVGSVLALVYSASLLRVAPAERDREASGYEDRYYLPSTEWLPLFSLGHREALADLIWMRALIYFGDEMVHRGRLRHARAYVRSILALDPDFRRVYHWTGISTFYGPVGATPEDGEDALSIMEEGCARFPDDGELQWETGALYAFELAHLQTDPADRARAQDRGVAHLIRATELGAAPAYAALSNAALLERVGRAKEAASHLEEMYATTTDPELRNEMAAHIEDLRSRAFREGFVEENRRFEDAWGREMPYAPAALYDLVGPIPVIDTSAVLRDGFGAHAFDDAHLLE